MSLALAQEKPNLTGVDSERCPLREASRVHREPEGRNHGQYAAAFTLLPAHTLPTSPPQRWPGNCPAR